MLGNSAELKLAWLVCAVSWLQFKFQSIIIKTLLPLNEFKTLVLTRFVWAEFVLIPIDGLDHLKNVVLSYLGHHCLLKESICL